MNVGEGRMSVHGCTTLLIHVADILRISMTNGDSQVFLSEPCLL